MRPPSRVSLPIGLPLEATTRGSGTVTRIAMESGSSLTWSLTGHQMSAPSVWQVVVIQGSPDGVRAQVNPPIQGGRSAIRGRPP